MSQHFLRGGSSACGVAWFSLYGQMRMDKRVYARLGKGRNAERGAEKLGWYFDHHVRLHGIRA